MKKEETNMAGYPKYPPSEDIYAQFEEELILNPEDLTEPLKNHKAPKTKGFLEKHLDEEDLDVPGAELDDAQEDIGSEDEENNYYSLGGDNHNNLDED
jgi:hypothetical protein